MKKTSKKPIKKKRNKKPIKKKADEVFSKWIRRRDAGICYTCGTKKDIKQMQNGHYIPRQHLATRYDEQNCHASCYGCNIARKGNMDEYAIRLKEQYGSRILEKLHKLKHTIIKFTKEDYQKIIDKYGEK